jgi:hypothetical protein
MMRAVGAVGEEEKERMKVTTTERVPNTAVIQLRDES